MPAGTPADLFTSTNQPKGRPKGRTGSRAKLAQRFFEDTYAAWEEQGPSVLARAAFHDPVAFANMVARLMPQKIEVSTPTDGMSDERLAELLDFAERMAGLKAEQAKVLQGTVLQPAVEVIEARSGDVAALPSPPHKLADENADLANSAEAGGGGPLLRMGGGGENTRHTLRADPAEAPDKTSNALNVLQPEAAQSGGEQKSSLPYPVGRAVPLQDREVERRNRKALDDIDPASLF